MKKIKIAALCISSLLILSACSGSSKTDKAFLKFVPAQGSVYNNCYVTLSERKLTYCDLDTGESTPVCSVPGCKHDGSNENCTARIKDEILSYPFRYRGKLYYFDSASTIRLDCTDVRKTALCWRQCLFLSGTEMKRNTSPPWYMVYSCMNISYIYC